MLAASMAVAAAAKHCCRQMPTPSPNAGHSTHPSTLPLVPSACPAYFINCAPRGMREFFEDNCAAFKGTKDKDEHQLTFMTLYKEYVA